MTGDGWIQAKAATLDEAIDAVLDDLDLDEDDAEIEVIASGRGGEAKVRARPRVGVDGEGDFDDAGTVEDDEDDFDDEDEIDVEKVEVATSFCQGLLSTFGLSGRVESWIDDEGVLRVELTGRDLGLLIGRRGKTLQGLVEVVRTVVQRKTGAHTRLFLDIEGFRTKRRAALAEYALRLGNRVVQSQVEIALEPMPAGDRKVIHDAVNSIDGASTFSEGEEPRRYVVISPGSKS